MNLFFRDVLRKIVEYSFLNQERKRAERVYKLLLTSFDVEDVAGRHITFQSKNWNRIFQQSKRNSRYYRRLFKDHKIATAKDFYRIPFLDKNTIKLNTKLFANNTGSKFQSFKFNTGGSTGIPLEFVASREAGLVDRVHQRFLFKSNGFKAGDRIVAFDGTVIPRKLRENNVFWIKKAIHQIPYGSIHFSSHYYNTKNRGQYVRRFMQVKPEFIRGYPSFISIFVDHLSTRNIKVNFVKGVHLTAENIYDWQVSKIERVLNCKVVRQYGHSEMAVYGFSRPGENSYYCSPYYGITEVINESGRHVEVGEIGEVAVTGLHNIFMPLIRYKTGDMAVYGGEKNGFVILEKLLGRTQDFIINKRNEAIPVTGIVFGQHFKSFSNIRKWQIQQKIPGVIDVFIIPGELFSESDQEDIKSRFSEVEGIKANIILTKELQLTDRGKHQFVVNELMPKS